MTLIEDAYCKVFGINDAEVLKQPEHQKVLATALTDVAYKETQFEGESERDMAKRLAMDGPAEGEVFGIAEYLKNLYPTEFKDKTSWEVLFEMYKRMNGVSETLNLSDTKIINIGGTGNMGTNALDELAKLEEQELGADVKGVTAPTAEANVAGVKVATDLITKQMEARKQLSKSATVSEIVLAKPTAEKILVQGTSSVGTIADVQKVFNNFCEKLGVVESNGEVTFSKVAPGQHDNAMTMYNELKAAIADPAKTFQVYISKATPSVVGYKFAESAGSEGKYEKSQELLNTLMTKSAGGFFFPDKAYQVRYNKATRKTNGKKGAGTGSNKNNYAGLVSLTIVDKKNAIEKYGVFHKEITAAVDNVSGFKSDLSVKYVKEAQSENNSAKYATFRIPLTAQAYVLQVTDEKKRDAFGTGERAVGRTVTAINFDNVDDITKDLSQILAAAAAVATDAEGVLGEIRQLTSEAEQANAASEQADIGANL